MESFFLICAGIGGTILVLQTLLSILGFGGDALGDVGASDLDLPDVEVPDQADAPGHEAASGLSNLGQFLTVQTVLAFITFFGVGGLSALQYGVSSTGSLVWAIGAGLLSMWLLGLGFGMLRKLQGDGTIRLKNAVGHTGRVYLRIPGAHGGLGKVTLPIQGRTEELRATTPGPELRTGETVVVTRLVDKNTVEVVAEAAYVAKQASLAE